MRTSRRCLFAIVVAVFVTLVDGHAVMRAAAGPNETTDLVAMYAHIAVGVGGATGPFTTVFYLSNGLPETVVVNVKCFNEIGQRVGPGAGDNVILIAFESEVRTPVTLGLTTDPNFTGLGFCYFAGNGEDFAVTFALGIQGDDAAGPVHPLLASRASLAIGASPAQAMVSNDDALAPLWLAGDWATFMIIVVPTGIIQEGFTVDTYTRTGGFVASDTRTLVARSVALYNVSANVGVERHGMVNISKSVLARGYMGWVYAVNGVSFQALLYDIAMDKDDVSALGAADRP
jgi:hypothetical protein